VLDTKVWEVLISVFKHLSVYLYTLYRLLLQFQHKKTYRNKTAGANGLPDYEHTMFETCRGHQELKCEFVGFCYIIPNKYAVQKNYIQRYKNLHQ
jgi:hypothetical protein